MPIGLYQAVEEALLQADPEIKCILVSTIFKRWSKGELSIDNDSPVLAMDKPGRPELPRLIDPRELERRSTASEQGQACLLHAFAHIEFNAINIALDAAYRYRDMPDRFIGDWLLVASEEAKHFKLLSQELIDRGYFYGSFDAHDGLWDMVCRTRHDVLHRIALVPRVMEARGLDVTPSMIERFKQIGAQKAVEILEIIYRDEIGHVRTGNHWYQFVCEQRGLDAAETFKILVGQYLNGKLRGPFNRSARLEAGFEEAEISALEQGLS